jgi:tRNA-2-methylthio-N6-dimethylallyladenosine synthase
MEDVGFDYSFSFLYSPRPGTPAAFIEDSTPHQTKLDRLSRLQAINTALGEAISRSMLGTSQRVLIEGVSRKKPDEMVGKTDNNRIVTIAKNEALTGHFVNVKITNTDNPRRLQGELI